MPTYKTIFLFVFSITLNSACRQPFEPEISGSDLEALVIEGGIDTHGGPSKVKIDLTRNLNPAPSPNTIPLPAKLNGTLTIEGEDGSEHQFHTDPDSPSIFQFSVELDDHQLYRVSITLDNGNHYESEWMKPMISPAMEELSFTQQEEGVYIIANTTGNEEAEYFFWDYEDDWIFRTPYMSAYDYIDGEITTLEDPYERTRCWIGSRSKVPIFETSEKYQNQQIQKRILLIPNGSEKLTERYSIKVRQWAISREAYTFWETLIKNTEDIGSIFGPVPSLAGSNFRHSENTEKPVIGFLHFGAPATKRIYIDRSQVQSWFEDIVVDASCEIDYLDTVRFFQYKPVFGERRMLPICQAFRGDMASEPSLTDFSPCPTYIHYPYDPPKFMGYFAIARECVDCTTRGTTTPPTYWEPQD